MRKLLLVILFVFFTHSALATTPSKTPENVSVKIDFNYLRSNQDGQSTQHQIENNIQMPTNNPKWTVVENKKINANKDIFILLARIAKASSKEINMDFLVLDTSSKPTVISEPRIIASYGQNNEIVILNGTEVLRLAVLAKV